MECAEPSCLTIYRMRPLIETVNRRERNVSRCKNGNTSPPAGLGYFHSSLIFTNLRLGTRLADGGAVQRHATAPPLL